MLDYRNLCEDAIKLTDGIQLNFDRPHNIILAGMGGSGISGDLVKDIVNLDIPIEVSKGYDLPVHANSNTLFICTSYSGNTEETLTQFVEAVKRKCSVISISSGGKLLEWSGKLDIPFIQLPAGYQPRDALPYLFFSLLSCLEKLKLCNFSDDKNEFLNIMQEMNFSKIDEIALAIKDSLPVIYGSSEFSGVMKRIKSELNENSKMFAKFDELPELNHNEVVGYEVASYPNISVIFIRDKDERSEISKRMEITKEIIAEKVNGTHEIWSHGNAKLAKVMSLVYQGDYLSFKLAELRNINREQVKTIDKVKEDLKSLNTVEKLEQELTRIQ